MIAHLTFGLALVTLAACAVYILRREIGHPKCERNADAVVAALTLPVPLVIEIDQWAIYGADRGDLAQLCATFLPLIAYLFTRAVLRSIAPKPWR